MRKKLCLTMCVLTLAMLTACGGAETESSQSESTTEEVVVETTEEVTAEPTEDVTEEVTEAHVVEPALAYTEDIAFIIKDEFWSPNLSVEVKTLNDYTLEKYYDEAKGKECFRYITSDGTTIEYSIADSFSAYESGIEQMEGYSADEVILTNADGKEAVYLYVNYMDSFAWQQLAIPIDVENDIYLFISIKPTETDENGLAVKINPEDYLELTRECYYNINSN